MSEIVKICKKHGELTIEHTYLLKTKVGNLIRMCSICKKGYRNDWAKLNPEKVKISQVKTKEKRFNELQKGTLKMNCRVHGGIPIDRIRIDARGTRICRICSNEQSYNSHEKNPNYKENQKVWYHSDIERKRRYAENDRPKRKIRQRRYYHELKVKDPEKHQYKESLRRKAHRKSVKNLSDYYVKSLLKTIRSGGRKNRFYHYLSGAVFPQYLIDLVKNQIKLKRKLKEKKCQK